MSGMDENDQQWRRLRRMVIVDQWATRFAYLMVAVALFGLAVSALHRHWGMTVVFAVLAAAAFFVGRWEPALFKSIDFEDEE